MLYCFFKRREGCIIADSFIKAATLDDLSECTALYIKVFNSAPWEENWTYETAEERLRDLFHTPKFVGYSLYQSGKLIGFAAGHQKSSPEGSVFYIAELCIDQEMQGQGCGSLLLEALEESLISRGVTSIYLLTSTDGPAEHFYLKRNYTVNKNRVVMNKTL